MFHQLQRNSESTFLTEVRYFSENLALFWMITYKLLRAVKILATISVKNLSVRKKTFLLKKTFPKVDTFSYW